MESIKVEANLLSPADQVRELFWDIERWQGIWNPVQGVKVLYDDGRFQEFKMDLAWNGATIAIRTIRIREANGDISFFSPNPPGEFRHHVGRWSFTATTAGACILLAERNVIVRRQDGEPKDEYLTRKAKVCSTFRARLTRMLDSFQAYFARTNSR